MEFKIKSFKEMKECGELPEPQLKVNSPEEQEYTRLKRQQLTGEGSAKKETSGKWAVVDEYDDVKYFDNKEEAMNYYFANGNEDHHLEVMSTDDPKFKKRYGESKEAKKESASDYRVGERVDYDGDTFEVIEIDVENDQVLIENMDGDNSFWVYASELDEEFDESAKKSKKESFIRGYRSQDGDYAQASCNEDGTDCDVSFFGNDEDENPDEIIDEKHFDTIEDAETYLKDEGFHDIRESVKKEASNGYDILHDVEKDFYYIEGPDGIILDDDGNSIHFDSREDAEDYVDTMLLN